MLGGKRTDDRQPQTGAPLPNPVLTPVEAIEHTSSLRGRYARTMIANLDLRGIVLGPRSRANDDTVLGD